MRNENYEPLALMLQTRVDGPTYPGDDRERWTGTATLVTVGEDGAPRNITSGGNLFNDTRGKGDFVVKGTLPSQWAREGSTGSHWEIKIGSDHYGALDISDAIETGKFAALVQRRLDAIALKRGSALTFGQYVLYVAEATGAKAFLVADDATARTYTDTTWNRLTGAQVRDFFDGSLSAFVARHTAVPA